jgi:hypothetical protein
MQLFVAPSRRCISQRLRQQRPLYQSQRSACPSPERRAAAAAHRAGRSPGVRSYAAARKGRVRRRALCVRRRQAAAWRKRAAWLQRAWHARGCSAQQVDGGAGPGRIGDRSTARRSSVVRTKASCRHAASGGGGEDSEIQMSIYSARSLRGHERRFSAPLGGFGGAAGGRARAAGRGLCFEQLRGTDAPEERGAYRAPRAVHACSEPRPGGS